MKNKVWLFTAALLLFTAGCGEPDMAQNKINSNEQKTAGISDTDEMESEIDSSASEKMEAVEEKSLKTGDHGTTYGGNPLVGAAVDKVLEMIISSCP